MIIYKIVLKLVKPHELRSVKIRFLTNHRGSLALPTPCFGLLASRTVREYIAVVLSKKKKKLVFFFLKQIIYSKNQAEFLFLLSDLTGHRKHYTKREMTTFHQYSNPKLFKWVYAFLYQF